MKRIMFLLAFVAVLGMVNAQTPDVVVKRNVNYGAYTGTAADTILATSTADALFYIEYAAFGRYTLSFYVEGDDDSGSGNVTIQAQGSYEGVSDFDNIGSAVTWTGGQDYNANTTLNTFTEVTAAATDYVSGLVNGYDSLGSSGVGDYLVDDTITVAQRTVTVTLPGLDYRFIKILLTGASGADVDIDKIAVKVTPIEGKLN